MTPSPNEEFLSLLPGDDEPSGFGRVADALRWGESRLRKTGIVGARLQATLLLGHAMGFDRAQLLARLHDPVSADVHAAFRDLVERRAAHVPLQYLRGQAPFLDFELAVHPGVFIPRPETEMVVERALLTWNPWREGAAPPPVLGQRTGELPFGPTVSAEHGAGVWAVDVGTGSGAIAIALARRRPRARVCAIDTSPVALRTAARNAERLGVRDRVLFLQGDLLEALGAADGTPPEAIRRAVGLLISNPPYAAHDDDVDPEVREHEPRDAWAAGPTGTEIYARLIPQAAEILLPGRPFVLELGYGQEKAVRRLLEADARWSRPVVEPDFQDIPRILVAHRR